MNPPLYFRNRNERRARMLRKMANMRAAKERKRLAAPPPDPEPKMIRWHPFEFAVRDKRTGEIAWHDLVSIRHAARALGLILKHCA